MSRVDPPTGRSQLPWALFVVSYNSPVSMMPDDRSNGCSVARAAHGSLGGLDGKLAPAFEGLAAL
eukprot:7681452-Pyramimonas_sp.AAC.1